MKLAKWKLLKKSSQCLLAWILFRWVYKIVLIVVSVSWLWFESKGTCQNKATIWSSFLQGCSNIYFALDGVICASKQNGLESVLFSKLSKIFLQQERISQYFFILNRKKNTYQIKYFLAWNLPTSAIFSRPGPLCVCQQAATGSNFIHTKHCGKLEHIMYNRTHNLVMSKLKQASGW